MNYHLLAGLALSLSLAACSSTPPSFGDHLAQRSAKADAIAKQWKDGEAAVAKGNKLLKKGQELVEDGQKDQKKGQSLIEEGQQLVENGKKQMADSEAAYQDMRSNPIPPTAKP
jgi:hypothetical protein